MLSFITDENFRRCVAVNTLLKEHTATIEKNDKIINFREPTEADGKEMFRIVEESKVLDVNSSYSYLLWGKYFNKTSILATCEGEAVGFITGFIPPEQPDTLFVWQVAVDNTFRGYGLATHLIHQLLFQVNREADVDHLEATVTPSNIPSSKLFQGIAKKNDTDCAIFECFSEDHFPGEGHEAELTYRVGPIEIEKISQ